MEYAVQFSEILIPSLSIVIICQNESSFDLGFLFYFLGKTGYRNKVHGLFKTVLLLNLNMHRFRVH